MALEENKIPSLHEYLDQKEGLNDESFTIEDDAQANWALRKLQQLQTEKEENIKLANAEIQKIEEWLNSKNDEVQRSVDFFQSQLSEFAMKKRIENPKFKSLKLPNGKLGFRKQQPKWEYDNDTVLKSLKSSGREDLIRVKEEPDKSAIKKVFVISNGKAINPETGEFVDGITVIEREDAFKVEV